MFASCLVSENLNTKMYKSIILPVVLLCGRAGLRAFEKEQLRENIWAKER
jgi:hypothetical protein